MANIAQLLTEHIDIWAAAESEKKSGRGRASGNAGSVYGVKKLRELILELAVRGKLVLQDTNDEPASELLKRIQAEKAKLIAEGKLKKEKPLAPIDEDEKPFTLPNGWEWLRLGQTGRIFNGNSINENEKLDKYTNLKNGYPFIATKDVGYGRVELDYDNGVLIPKEDCSLKVAQQGAVLICAEGGSAGKKVGVTNQDICFGNKLFANELWVGIEPFYIFHLYQSVTFYSLFQQKMTGIIGGISLNEFLSIPAPIPPFAEQHRIVAKVDELMVLCDQLEQQHSNAQEAHETLVSQLLATLTQSQSAADFNANWQRIYAHFDELFTTEASIDALKQTLLQLAVMGKLVPQDPNDEPASELLKRIQAEKAKLISEGKLKKEKTLGWITDDEKPFPIPETWCWIRLGNIHEITSSKRIHAKDYQSEGVPFFRSKEIGELGRGRGISTEIYISQKQFDELKNAPGFPHCGDLMLASIGGSIGNNWLCDNREFYYKDGNITKIGNHDLVNMFYLKMFIDSSVFWSQVTSDVAGSAYNALTIIKIKELSYPLPPLTEQHRIVAKVDALMALCDNLKTRITQSNQQQQKLAVVLVAQAVA